MLCEFVGVHMGIFQCICPIALPLFFIAIDFIFPPSLKSYIKFTPSGVICPLVLQYTELAVGFTFIHF